MYSDMLGFQTHHCFQAPLKLTGSIEMNVLTFLLLALIKLSLSLAYVFMQTCY